MRQVTAMGQIHPQNGITWFEEGKISAGIGLCAGMRLHVGMFGPEQRFGPFNRQRFGNIYAFAAAVIAGCRITFGIFVGQYGALGFQNRRADKVFRCDQLDLVVLARCLHFDCPGDLRVLPGKNAHVVSSTIKIYYL